MDHFFALIMAGGGGTRLWPLSRRHRPKQVLSLTEERTMFQVTVDRLRDLFPPERIFVVTGRAMADLIRQNSPHIPDENFLIEPEGRDSGPAAGWGTMRIYQEDPDAVIAVLSADHFIANEQRFLDALRCARDMALQNHIVTLGIEATFASTGFGYIQRADKLSECGEFTVYKAERFTEKPDEETAAKFLESGLYSWNAGIFIWKAATALAEFESQQPAMFAALKEVTDLQRAGSNMEAAWSKIDKLSVDYAIMEHVKSLTVIPVSIGWSDIGNWAALFEALEHDENDNALRSSYDGHIQIDTRRTLIVSEKMIVTIGLENMIIVQTDDATLICSVDRVQDVREVVQRLKDRGQLSHL